MLNRPSYVMVPSWEQSMKRCLSLSPILVLLVCWTNLRAAESSSARMVVHEWGTFTTLQDADGTELSGINIDDEPVPEFVHNLQPHLLDHPILSHDYWAYRQKGTPRRHPLVLMRLETPVIYFYPPRSAKLPLKVDVDVKFRGGWLTEFYPTAKSQPAENADRPFDFGVLTRETVGRLTWSDLQVGQNGRFPETTEQVWLAPRKVASVPITTAEGESEQYLFYRGVAHLHAPLRVSTSQDGTQIQLRANFQDILTSGESERIGHLWLVETRADGTTAFRKLDPIVISSDPRATLLTAQRRFSTHEFSSENRVRLEQDMHRALLAEGLFADEATALLTTWQRAYFASPGLRVFFTVPRRWTDHYLPLTISGKPEVTRVMIGRVELISDSQRGALGKLAAMKQFSSEWIHKIPETSPAYRKLLAGRSVDPRELGDKVPPDFHLYLGLGRFRNALVIAEEGRTGGENLERFIAEYGLQMFRPRQAEK